MANKPGEANFFPDVPQFPSMGTFQPVYGKFDLTTYIQGASDYEIMAFLVGKYNACLEAYGNITKLSTDTITACKQLQDWINSWFDNLDVQEEINKKIDSMVADGSFGTLLHQTFDAQINQQTTSAVTAWLVANVTPTGSAVVVDKSLSIEGAAADAKVTGERFSVTPWWINSNNNAKIDINTFFIGTGTPTTESIDTFFDTFGLSGTSSDYEWSVLSYAPATADSKIVNYDTIQILTASKSGIIKGVYIRTAYAKSFFAWKSFFNESISWINPNDNAKIDINTFFIGTGTPTTESIDTFFDTLGLSGTSSDYEWSVLSYAPATADSKIVNYDTIQILTASKSGIIKGVYIRTAYAKSFFAWKSFFNESISWINSINNTKIDINTFFIGTGTPTTESIDTFFETLGLSGTSSDYEWSVLSYAPATSGSKIGNYDSIQILTASKSGIIKGVYFRTSYAKSFFEWKSIFNASINWINSINNTKIDINTFFIGTGTPTTESIDTFFETLGLSGTSSDYEWSVLSYAPATSGSKIGNYDSIQILTASKNGIIEGFYIRTAYAKSFFKWKRIVIANDGIYFAFNFNKVDINNAGLGHYSVNEESLQELLPDIYDKYYWSVDTYGQVTDGSASNYDTIQWLTGIAKNNSDTVIYIRHEYIHTWSTFSLIFTTAKSSITTKMKIATLGDSFTNDPTVYSYSYYLNQYPQFEVTNLGIDGSTAGTWYDKRSNEITDYYDMFFIAFGLNTDKGGMGTIDSTDTSTFYGGFNAILQKIFTVNPTARIMLWCMDAWYTKEKSDAVKALADKYGCEYHSMKAEKEIPVRIDGKFAGIWDELNSTYVNARTKAFAKTDSNHHPVSKGNKFLADYLATIL